MKIEIQIPTTTYFRKSSDKNDFYFRTAEAARSFVRQNWRTQSYYSAGNIRNAVVTSDDQTVLAYHIEKRRGTSRRLKSGKNKGTLVKDGERTHFILTIHKIPTSLIKMGKLEFRQESRHFTLKKAA